MPDVAKITISLPTPLLAAIDQLAQQERRTRSGLVHEALSLFLRERDKQEMIKGYQQLRGLHKELTGEALAAGREVWVQYD
jgi:metal-responsive CopG/Arc/MetJ family transcriptional regulator